jgi:large subunit ribosomal protein L31e
MSTNEENLSRVYTINLGRAWLTPQYKRTDRVINMIREFAQKHMKSADIKLDQDLNRQIWSRGKTNPPRKIRVKMVKDEDGIVVVSGYEDLVVSETKTSPSPAGSAKPEEVQAETKQAESKEETRPENKTGEIKAQSETVGQEENKTLPDTKAKPRKKSEK